MSKSTHLNQMIDNPLQSIWNIWKILLSDLGSLFVFDVEIKTSEADDWQSITRTINMKHLKHFLVWLGHPLYLWCWNQDFWSEWLTFHDNHYGCHQFQTFCCLTCVASMSLMSKSTLLNQMIDNQIYASSTSASNILLSGQDCLFVLDVEINTFESDDW